MGRADAWTVCVAATKDKYYIQMVGMKHVVNNMEHRKEFVTGNLAEFMTRGTPHSRFCMRLPDCAYQSSRKSRSASDRTTHKTLLSCGESHVSASV